MDKTSLASLEENDIIKVYYRQDLSKKYEICEMSRDSTILLRLSDYVQLNQNNQIAGMIVFPICIFGSLFLIVEFTFKLKNLNKKVDLGNLKIEHQIDGHIICVYKSATACSLVIDGKIIDQYCGAILNCRLIGRLKINKCTFRIIVKIDRANLQLYCNENLLNTTFIGFD